MGRATPQANPKDSPVTRTPSDIARLRRRWQRQTLRTPLGSDSIAVRRLHRAWRDSGVIAEHQLLRVGLEEGLSVQVVDFEAARVVAQERHRHHERNESEPVVVNQIR